MAYPSRQGEDAETQEDDCGPGEHEERSLIQERVMVRRSGRVPCVLINDETHEGNSEDADNPEAESVTSHPHPRKCLKLTHHRSID